MTTYTNIADSEIDPESPGTTTLFTKLRDNPIAITEKAAGAPVLANNYVTNAMMDASSVGDTELIDDNITFAKLKVNGVLNKSLTSSETYIMPAGLYNGSNVTTSVAHVSGNWVLAMHDGYAWRTLESGSFAETDYNGTVVVSSQFFSDGTNVRFVWTKSSGATAVNIEFKRIAF